MEGVMVILWGSPASLSLRLRVFNKFVRLNVCSIILNV